MANLGVPELEPAEAEVPVPTFSRVTAEGNEIIAEAANATTRQVPPPEPLPADVPLEGKQFMIPLPSLTLNRQRLADSDRRDSLINKATAMSKHRGPLFCSLFFVVCNLKKEIQLAPDFVEHDRLYHPLCTFRPPSTADIEGSLHDFGRFEGCLLFQDRETADALREEHRNVKQIVLIACRLPAILSDGHTRLVSAGYPVGLFKSLVRLVLRDCDKLTKLPDKLADCVALRTLVVHNCKNLRNFGALLDTPNLEHLFLLSCPQLQGHLDLSRLHDLRLCVARQCGLLTVVVDDRHKTLLQLVLGWVLSLQSNNTDAPDVASALQRPWYRTVTLPTSLLYFSFEDTSCRCPVLVSPEGENEKIKLEGVSFSRSKLLSSLPDSIHLGALQQLNIIGCTVALDQQRFMEHTLPQLTSLKQLRASIALDQVCKHQAQSSQCY